jgi:hypothetical protein
MHCEDLIDEEASGLDNNHFDVLVETVKAPRRRKIK